jgi:two-component system, NarL family, sensor histidine kinase FusK
MVNRIGGDTWLRHIALAVAYALGYTLLRSISFPHWVPLAGFRLCALLLLPYRYWPALLVGETSSLAYTSFDCADQYGWLWGAMFMVPPMAFAMPVVRWCREHHRLFPSRSATSMNVLLLCALSVSIIWAAVNIATFAAMRLPPGYPPVDLKVFAGRYFLGNYVGVLTFVPLALLLREELLTTHWRRLWTHTIESRLVLETISLLLPSLALLVWLASGAAGEASQTARVAMFLPVAWLALRHGWRGAAVGGTAASIAVVLTMPAMYDDGTLRAQVFIAFTITTMLLLGARIAVLHERETRERADARVALAMAQRNVYLGEMQLRQTSYALEQMSGAIQASYTQMLGRLRCLLPGTDERTYYRQAALAQHQIYRLADTLYPLSWGEKGLPAALREGSLPRALDEAGVVYWCDISGEDLTQLSVSVHMALYRLVNEAIAYSCAKRNVSKINVRLRSGMLGGRRWAVVCVDSLVDYERLARVRWDDLLPRLGGSGMGLGALKDRAGVFEGKVRARPFGPGHRISMILFDPELA